MKRGPAEMARPPLLEEKSINRAVWWRFRQPAGRLIEREIVAPRPGMPLHLAWRSRQIGKALAWFLDELAKTEEVAALTAGL